MVGGRLMLDTYVRTILTQNIGQMAQRLISGRLVRILHPRVSVRASLGHSISMVLVI